MHVVYERSKLQQKLAGTGRLLVIPLSPEVSHIAHQSPTLN